MSIQLLEKRKKHKNDDEESQDQETVDQDVPTATESPDDTSDAGGDNSNTDDGNYGNAGDESTSIEADPYASNSSEDATSSYSDGFDDYGTTDNGDDSYDSTASVVPYDGTFATTAENTDVEPTTPVESSMSDILYPTTTTLDQVYATTPTSDEVYATTTSDEIYTTPTPSTSDEVYTTPTPTTSDEVYSTPTPTTSDEVYTTPTPTPTTSDEVYSTPTPTTSDEIYTVTSTSTTLLESATMIPYSSSFTLSSSSSSFTTTVMLPISSSMWSSTTSEMSSFTSAPIATATSALDQGDQGASSSDSGGLSQKSKAIIGGCVGGIGGAIVLGMIAFWWISRWKRQRRETDMESYRPESDYSGLSVNSQTHSPYYDHDPSFNAGTPNMSADQMIQTRY